MILFLACVMDRELIWGLFRGVIHPGGYLSFGVKIIGGAGVTGYEKPLRGYYDCTVLEDLGWR